MLITHDSFTHAMLITHGIMLITNDSFTHVIVVITYDSFTQSNYQKQIRPERCVLILLDLY